MPRVGWLKGDGGPCWMCRFNKGHQHKKELPADVRFWLEFFDQQVPFPLKMHQTTPPHT